MCDELISHFDTKYLKYGNFKDVKKNCGSQNMDILSKDPNHFIFLSSTKNLDFTHLKFSRHNFIYMHSPNYQNTFLRYNYLCLTKLKWFEHVKSLTCLSHKEIFEFQLRTSCIKYILNNVGKEILRSKCYRKAITRNSTLVHCRFCWISQVIII